MFGALHIGTHSEKCRSVRDPKEEGLPTIATFGSFIILASGEFSHESAIPLNILINLIEAGNDSIPFFSYCIYLRLL